MEAQFRLKTSSQDATSATLAPVAGHDAKGGALADTVATVVVTFTNARDSKFFSEANREFEVIIRRR